MAKKKEIMIINGKENLKQEIFCQTWVDTIGNGTLSSLAAFDIKDKQLIDIEFRNKPTNKKDLLKWQKDYEEHQKRLKKVYSTAAAMASEYLRKPNIIKRIDEILEERGFNDDAVKREHFKLMTGSKDEVRIRAVDSYYKLKGKFIEKKEISGLDGGPIQVKFETLTDDELIKQYESRIKTK